MRQLFLVFYFAGILSGCRYSTEQTHTLTIDPSIEEKVFQNFSKYDDSLHPTNDDAIIANKLMFELYTNDTLTKSTYTLPNFEAFKSTYFWTGGTLVINAEFSFGAIGFSIRVNGKVAKVDGVMQNNLYYKNTLTDSIHSYNSHYSIKSGFNKNSRQIKGCHNYGVC